MKKQYTHLTDEERIEFYALRKAGFSILEISKAMGRHRSTLYRELKRNSGKRSYRPKQAQARAEKRRKTPRHQKWSADIEEYISRAIKVDLSPQQIRATMILDGYKSISHERIYQYIYNDMKDGGSLYTHLRIRGTKK